jgi:hypothetical protein
MADGLFAAVELLLVFGSVMVWIAYFGENEQSDRSNLNRASGPI